jgi:hypothetical protein
MNHWMDQTLVGIVLAASAGYAILSLGPLTWRRRILAALSRAAANAPPMLRLSTWSQKLGAAAAVKAKGGCGGCEDCGTGAGSTQQSAAAEIKIPVGKIGRRA